MQKKINIMKFILYISFLVVIVRMYYLQILKHEDYLMKMQELNTKIVYGDTMPRGKIYDRNGNLLVDNTLVKTIYYRKDSKKTFKQELELAYFIKDFLELDYSKLTNSYLKDFYILEHENEIQNRISKEDNKKFKRHEITNIEYYKLKKEKVTLDDLNIYDDEDKKAIYLYYLMNTGYSYDDKIIKLNASEEEFAFFSESDNKLSGFHTKYTYDRNYYYGDTLKNIFGSIGKITSENKEYYLKKGYSLNDIVGISNLEYVYDDYLKGEKAIYKLENKEKILMQEGKVGKDLYLTIDIDLQTKVDEILKKEILLAKRSLNTKYFDRSYITISNPNNGDILAISGKIYQNNKVNDYPIGAILDSMVSGSVVKGASILVGYNEGKIKIGEYMQDECIKIKSTPKKCSIYTMGYVNDLDALKKSSNVYQFKIALRVGGVNYQYDRPAYVSHEAFEIYRSYFQKFGLGTSTGIDLNRENIGIKGKDENAGLLMNLAIGQYDSYTNISLNQYISTLANGNKRYSLHFLKEIKNKDEVIKTYEPIILNTLDIDEKYIKRVKQGLKLVMSEGTGVGYIDLSHDPSGKTGTSETFVDTNQDGIYETPTISTAFVAYFPSNNPEYAISITTPNISYVNSSSSYIYPFNKLVIRKITDLMLS